jgi:hypothetical protein
VRLPGAGETKRHDRRGYGAATSASR